MKKYNYELHNITRFDQERPQGKGGSTHGWWVRFKIKGKNYTQLFSDNKFGGKDKALKIAKTYRDALEREIRPKQITSNPSLKSKRNRSGIVGVNRSKSTTHRNKKKYTYSYWQAHWPTPDGKIGKKNFRSINTAKRKQCN